jgi:predicted nucleic acid-binding protein
LVFLDTSFILALENRDDPLHARAKLLARELTASQTIFVLHWGVLLEIGDGYARLGRRVKGLELFEKFQHEEGCDVQPIDGPLFEEALALYRARQDKEWGLTDCVSFVLMRRLGMSDALTADVHFRQAGFSALLLD